jgi:hypothetical protein
MRNLRLYVFAFLAMLASACAGTGTGPSGVKAPRADQPRLESVRLTGNRMCGSTASTAGASTYTFNCPPLPTIEASGWLMSPAYAPSALGPQRLHANRTAVINVSAPPLTELDIELVRGGGQLNLPLTQVEPNAIGAPGEVSASRQVGVTTIDDGRKKTWLVEVNVSSCADSRELQFFNRSTRSETRSNPLSVYLVRDPGEEICVGQSGPNPAARAGVGEPINPRPEGGCPGGGTGKLFQVCESCASLHPQQLSFYSAGTYCSWEEVLAVYGYTGTGVIKPQICKLTQTSSKEACEGK